MTEPSQFPSYPLFGVTLTPIPHKHGVKLPPVDDKTEQVASKVLGRQPSIAQPPQSSVKGNVRFFEGKIAEHQAAVTGKPLQERFYRQRAAYQHLQQLGVKLNLGDINQIIEYKTEVIDREIAARNEKKEETAQEITKTAGDIKEIETAITNIRNKRQIVSIILQDSDELSDEEDKENPFIRAIQSFDEEIANHNEKLVQAKETLKTLGELLQFLETPLVYRSEETGLPRTLHVTPEGKAFILLKKKSKGDKPKIAGAEEGIQKIPQLAIDLDTLQPVATLTSHFDSRWSNSHGTYVLTEKGKQQQNLHRQETKILPKLQHIDGVVKILTSQEYQRSVQDAKQKKKTPFKALIVQEFCDGKSLEHSLNKHLLDDGQKHQFGLKLLTTMIAIHDTGILVNDIKTDNLLLKTDPSGKPTIKFIDFGTSCDNDEKGIKELHDMLGTSPSGSPFFQPPEALQKHLYRLDPKLAKQNLPSDIYEKTKNRSGLSTQSDVWAMGCVFLQLFYGRASGKWVPGINPSSVQYPFDLATMGPESWEKGLKEVLHDWDKEGTRDHLVFQMLRYNVEERISDAEALRLYQQLPPPDQKTGK